MSVCIAVIEDDASVRELMVMVLQDAGYEAIALPDAYDAVGTLQHANAAALILDLHGTSFFADDGLDLLAHLQQVETLRTLPVLVCSADAAALDAHAAQFAASGYHSLVKPFDLEELLEWLNTSVPIAVPVASRETALPGAR